ncbi:MAG: nicotinamide riboside transporter PnuC [Pseudomonadota bacterium]|jgi:nicotinamide mononucleotide transporter|nr:nicotinamide riboside transporter PnuC [Hyphomicrobiales bacterium]MEC7890222.1 nicotinamide riboside transporter PnuC [Pseudomonadota bacterium]|tara:strand:+ start:1718 stop:2311 length:594 start_codon:yes stop_codon:yes gene_type:complete
MGKENSNNMFIALEIFAVIFALLYLFLAMKQNIACWYAAFISTLIYIIIYWDVSLYMESLLNFYYLLMAIYGWINWNKKSQIDKNYVISWSYQNHIVVILLILILTVISGFSLQKTDAVYPYLDSFTTWASVITTFMVAQKILSNWIFWIIINSVAIFLNFDRELYLTVILLMTYQVMSIYGYYQWRKSYYEYKSQN